MSEVYFISSRVRKYKGLPDRFASLLKSLDLPFIQKNNNVCIKTHFGEDGNTGFINPIYIRKVVDFIRSRQAHPFVGDTNTLYSGRRKNGTTHLELALEHGFSYASINAPLVILDGLKSDYFKEIIIDQKNFRTVQLAGELINADAAIVMSHVKGHMVAGMGGAVKNLAMGFGTRTQKQRMHGDIKPLLIQNKCISCYTCKRICPENAIVGEKENLRIELDKCVGCAECITHCPTEALRILWNETPVMMAEKMAETALGVMRNKAGKIWFCNFLLNITPDCDCMGWSDNSVINDLGILLSDDPVALDKASYDMINQQPVLHNSKLENKTGEVFGTLHPGIDPLHQLVYGEKIGLGSLHYELKEIE